MTENMETRFNELISERIANKGKNSQLFTIDQYKSVLTKVKEAKNKTRLKTPEDYQRLARYDVINLGTTERLITPVKREGDPIIFYVHLSETFQIIHNCHINIGHGGRGRMMKELKLKYKNITAETVAIYLRLCESCQGIKCLPNNRFGEPVTRNEVYSKCQVDLIDMQTQPDGDFNYIMVYQDLQTQFVQLRPSKSKEAKEIANHLLDIFTIFGAPSILQSCYKREFASEMVKEVCAMRPDLKIVHGEARYSVSQHVDGADKHIKQMLCTWLESNKTTKWSEGLRFIQFMKNKAFHTGINRSPYEAMFGCKAKAGLNSFFPQETLARLSTEKELNMLFYQDENHDDEKETEADLSQMKVEPGPEFLFTQNENRVLQKEEFKPEISKIKVEVESEVGKETSAGVSNIKKEENNQECVTAFNQNENLDYQYNKIKTECYEIEWDPCNENEEGNDITPIKKRKTNH